MKKIIPAVVKMITLIIAAGSGLLLNSGLIYSGNLSWYFDIKI